LSGIFADGDPAGGSEVRCQFGAARHGCAAAWTVAGPAFSLTTGSRRTRAGCVSGMSAVTREPG